jgi:hypothetical protein
LYDPRDTFDGAERDAATGAGWGEDRRPSRAGDEERLDRCDRADIGPFGGGAVARTAAIWWCGMDWPTRETGAATLRRCLMLFALFLFGTDLVSVFSATSLALSVSPRDCLSFGWSKIILVELHIIQLYSSLIPPIRTLIRADTTRIHLEWSSKRTLLHKFEMSSNFFEALNQN